MQFSTSFVRSVYTAVMLASAAVALPFAGSLKHTTMQVRTIGVDKTVESFHPESSFETFSVNGIDHPLSARDEFSFEDAALSFVQWRLNVTPDATGYRAGYASDVAQHAYIYQQINGIPVANAVANVAFNKANKVVSFGSSFVKPSNVSSSTPSISAADAISKAERELSGTYNQHPTKLEFVAKRDRSVALTHVVQVRDDRKAMWYEVFVDAHSGDIVQLTDFVAHASYRVLPITKQNITQGFETLTNPQNTAASLFGWHSDGVNNSNDTSGNNVITYAGAPQFTTVQSSATLNFVYIQDPTRDPDALQANIDAARVNAFYIVNTVHDISYLYGFNGAAFNFQNNNFGKGGAGNDRVEVSVQDTSGKNNAAFATPPDGQSGLMQMYVFDQTAPERDGALENDIVVHENTHGITNRMTGGGTARCLQTLEAGGLGEGWSDALAEWTEWTDATVTDWVTGTYVLNNPAGVRTHPYSTNANTNPLRYSSLLLLFEVHKIGEVWANMLHNVYAQLVAVHGFSDTAKTDPTTTGGNAVYLHLFIDALAIQPCNPTFVKARDAWIQADANRYNGANFCLLWRVFASRGLGVNAALHIDDTTVPANC
ncbi:Fungalysin metallopeptidase-domain-containing protein [Ganoderma leucocontextum]|nr:Fungalysin metallopeptidase-domain-containing protein [Ganoderma leucocontextum]